jgi:hypothetical protein
MTYNPDVLLFKISGDSPVERKNHISIVRLFFLLPEFRVYPQMSFFLVHRMIINLKRKFDLPHAGESSNNVSKVSTEAVEGFDNVSKVPTEAVEGSDNVSKVPTEVG